MTLREIRTPLLLLIAVGLGIIIGPYVRGAESTQSSGSEMRLGGTGLTNPLLECEIGRDTIASRKEDFTPELEDIVDGIKQENAVEDIAVYFRDLNNGPIVGANQESSFAPASLLKVPVLIAYLRYAEDRPDVLDELITYDKPYDVGYVQQFAPSVPLELGRTYTARELLEIMTKYSDNQALVLLFNKLPARYQEELYVLLGVDPGLITDPTGRLTIRQYSIFFRILFNASFLSQAHSEYALRLLTDSTFVDGVRAGVPGDIEIAHKFGERRTTGGLQQFHDCGIVYYPNHPYLLCVMTRGNNVDSLIDSIKDVSEFVYEKVDEQYRGR